MSAKGLKVTIYHKGGGSQIVRTEGYLIGVSKQPAAGSSQVHYVKKGSSKEELLMTWYSPFWLLVEGWGHPKPDSIADPASVRSGGGVTTSRSRYMANDPQWAKDFYNRMFTSLKGQILAAHKGGRTIIVKPAKVPDIRPEEDTMQDKFSMLLEAIEGRLEEGSTPEGLRKGILETLKWLKGDIGDATAAAFKVQPQDSSKGSLNVVYNALNATRSLMAEVGGMLRVMEHDPTMAGVASQQNAIHLRSLVKKMGMRWIGEGEELQSEEVLSEDVPWEEVDAKAIPSHVKQVASTLRSANGAVLGQVYRSGGDFKLVFKRPGGLYLNRYTMQKLVKVLGRDEDVLGDSTNSGFVVVLH